MSIILGALSIFFIALAKLDRKFYLGAILCFFLFILLIFLNDNKFLDFTYFFFATGISQILISFAINFKEIKK